MKKMICLLLVCLMLFVLASCQDDKLPTETTTNAPETSASRGEPADPNNQYAKDNNAYYVDAWKH